MNSGLIPWEPVGRSGRRGGLGAIVLAVACSAASVFGAAVSGADVFGGDVRGTDLASGAGTEAEVDRIIAEADRSLVDALVPAPKRVAAAPGMFRATYRVRVIAETPALARHAAVVAEELHRLTGISAVVGTGGEDDLPVIRLRLTPPAPGQEPILDAAGLPAEGFRLDIGPQEIIAAAATPVGVAWATATLLPLIVPDAEGPLAIPCGAIEDAPDAAYRSVMIDVARQPHTIRVLEDVVRLARLARIRFVHLHLTDDQLFTFPFAPVTDAIANNTAYTRGELAGLVQYASDRGVTLVPEIDLPGHSRRLIESGYLPDAASHADVASERHWERLSVLLADVMDVFERSLYFHIGGDESQAGAALVPFLARVNALVRERGKRLIVWEGFHGAPVDMIPSTGPDRVLVAAWESSYNPPWDLLAAGYEIINASWAPLYIVGGGGRVHPGATGGRRWEPSVLAGWDRHTFMHWEPGRPVFEDRGPADDDRDDGIWRVPQGAGRGQVLGGQVSVWEQHERSLLGGLRHRLPVVGARLWNPDDDRDLLARLGAVDDRLWGLVQPVSIEFDAAVEPGPMNRIAAWRPAGSDADANANAVADADADAKATANADAVADADANPNPNPNPNPNANANANATPNPPTIRLRNRTAGAGTIRWSWRPFGGDWGWIDFRAPDVPATECTGLPIRPGGSGTLRVGLYAGDGTRIGGETWWQGLDWPARVQVTEYAIGRRTPRPGTGRDGGRIPDFDALGPDAITARYRLPILRGPIDHEHIRGQRFEATIQSPGTGTFELGLKTQNGHATAWIDLNRDGVFSEAERLIPETPSTEERLRAPVEMTAGERYPLRVDHVSGMPRPVVIVTLDVPGAERPKGITGHLVPMDG